MTKIPYTLQDVYDGEAQDKFNVISTFAGGGGSSTGYRLAGGKILCVNEFVEEARNTYAENYPSTIIIPDDIKELTGKDFLKATGLKPGELDILDGSPPCSAFSIAGAHTMKAGKGVAEANWGRTKVYSDGKIVENIEDLFFEFIRVADEIRPKVIVAENVRGLTVGESKSYYAKITNAFEEIGYLITSRVLNASNYGVGQGRQRLIFIGVREDIGEEVGLNTLNVSTLFPDSSSKVTNLGDIIGDVKNDPEEVKFLLDRMKRGSTYQYLIQMPKNPQKTISVADYHPKGSCFNMLRFSFFKPAPTITTRTGNFMHWEEDRNFTTAEYKRIQSLPEDFKLTGNWAQQTERIGRMVPPLMMRAIADSIYTKLLSKLK